MIMENEKAIAGWTLGFLIGIIIFVAGLVIAMMLYTNFFQDTGKVANLFGGLLDIFNLP